MLLFILPFALAVEFLPLVSSPEDLFFSKHLEVRLGDRICALSNLYANVPEHAGVDCTGKNMQCTVKFRIKVSTEEAAMWANSEIHTRSVYCPMGAPTTCTIVGSLINHRIYCPTEGWDKGYTMEVVVSEEGERMINVSHAQRYGPDYFNPAMNLTTRFMQTMCILTNGTDLPTEVGEMGTRPISEFIFLFTALVDRVWYRLNVILDPVITAFNKFYWRVTEALMVINLVRAVIPAAYEMIRNHI